MKLKFSRKQSRHILLFSQPSSSYITQRVPLEILDIILEFLPAPDQACFALTCKPLYAYFISFIRTQVPHKPALQRLRPRFLLPREIARPILCRDIEVIEQETEQPRIQLLHRLEDSRWKFCRGCWNLHRHSAWQPPPRFSFRSFLTIRKKRCKPYAGKIEICPCWSFPVHRKRELKQFITTTEERYSDAREYFHNKLLYHWNHEAPLYLPGGTVGHDCVFQGHPFAELRIYCGLILDSYDKTFRQESLYKFEISLKDFRDAQKAHTYLGIRIPLICPHDNTEEWLRRFFEEAGSDFSAWKGGQISSGESCLCAQSKEQEKWHVSITVVSVLGR